MTQEGRARKPRHRRRATAAAGPPPPPVTVPEPSVAPAKPRTKRRDGGGERGLRDIAGTGSSQVGVSRALRARDVDRPSAQDLADAEAELQIVRRNWKPQS